MPSKLRRAIGAVKDRTSISIAKVSSNNASILEVAVLKTTTHDEAPLDDRYVNEVLQYVSTHKSNASVCAGVIAKRIGRTRNWIVALKSLMLVLRIFQDGDPYFPRDVLHVMKRGGRILNLTNFRDDSTSSPWEYTVFVRTFALYLDERLDCFLTGKLQRRFAGNERDMNGDMGRKLNPPVRDMKPGMLIDRIINWQRLLDRAVAAMPTGQAKSNKLVQVSLHAVVQESFDLYRDISDGLALLLDSFFHLHYQSCVNAFQACVKATKQFEDLSSFYAMCKSIGVGRISEYPSVQKISDELIDTLKEFLKDQASCTSNGRLPASQWLLPSPQKTASTAEFEQEEADLLELSEPTERLSGEDSGLDSNSNSVDDFLGMVDLGMSPPMFEEKQSEQDDSEYSNDKGSVPSLSMEQRAYSAPDEFLVMFNDHSQEQQKRKENDEGSVPAAADLWEIVLLESANQATQQSQDLSNGFQNPAPMEDFFNQKAVPDLSTNPFLQGLNETTASATTSTSFFPMSPTFQAAPMPPTFHAMPMSPTSDAAPMSPTFHATPTFSTQNQNDDMAVAMQNSGDPFAAFPIETSKEQTSNALDDQQTLQQEQQFWLEQQNKILANIFSLDSWI